MASLTVTYFGQDTYLFAHEPDTAVLTDEHAACSYGLPVVLVDGVPHGPAELPYGLSPVYKLTPYVGDPALYESDEQIRARRTPEGRDLVARAKVAGYRIV
jgi:hypothetical protein